MQELIVWSSRLLSGHIVFVSSSLVISWHYHIITICKLFWYMVVQAWFVILLLRSMNLHQTLVESTVVRDLYEDYILWTIMSSTTAYIVAPPLWILLLSFPSPRHIPFSVLYSCGNVIRPVRSHALCMQHIQSAFSSCSHTISCNSTS